MDSPDSSPACPLCSRRFTKKSSMVRHSKRCLQAPKAPPRQKACQTCVNKKLRCDLQRPRCSRCQKHTIQCEYQLSDDAVIPEATNETEPTVGTGTHQPASINDLGSNVNAFTHDNTVNSNCFALLSISTFDTQQRRDSGTPSINTNDEGTPSFVCNSYLSALDNSIESNNRQHAFNLPNFDAHSLEPDPNLFSEQIASKLVISDHRRKVLMGSAHNNPNHGVIAQHTAHFVTRVLKSWVRMMATHHTKNLPPVIHRLQLTGGIPVPLANCYTLVKMWAGRADGSHELVRNTIFQEVRRLFQEHHSFDESNLLAAAQSLLILLIILLFGPQQPRDVSTDAQVLVGAWDIKHALAKTGLFLNQESTHTMPSWKDWAIVSAKRRTILAFHHVEWSWSIKHGYPILTCFELGPLPAPAAKHLWQETKEESWMRLYEEWLRQWAHGSYRIAEFFQIEAGDALDERSEMWLAEVDEFGMMLMAEVNGIGDPE